MRGRLGELRKAPWTLWAYVGLSAAASVAYSLLGSTYVWFLPIGLGIGLLFGFFLLRGSRVMWWLLVLLELGAVPFYVVGEDVWRAPVTAISLVLLLAPPSRRYVFKPKPPEEMLIAARHPGELGPQTSWAPDDHDDTTRPPGWYFDPADPSRMRYWDAGLGGWQSKTTRAPRKLR